MKNVISILVVDDEPVLRDLLAKILCREGFGVATAVDGAEALERMAGETFDLVISDIQMPRLDGFGLLKKIKQDHPATAVIMRSAAVITFFNAICAAK